MGIWLELGGDGFLGCGKRLRYWCEKFLVLVTLVIFSPLFLHVRRRCIYVDVLLLQRCVFCVTYICTVSDKVAENQGPAVSFCVLRCPWC